MDTTSEIKYASSLAIGIGFGIYIGWLLKGKFGKNAIMPSMSKVGGNYKMVLVVRNDLKMGKGKIAAQCSHAAVDVCNIAINSVPNVLRKWSRSGQPKVVVKVDDEAALMAVARNARSLGLPVSVIADAGRTQIAAGSKTVVGIGPGNEEIINKITGKLKLL